jgi:hypothetical protein
MPKAAPTLSLRAKNRATLARQMLLARERVPATHAIERLVGMQAQWPRPPFVGLFSRVDRFRREELTRLMHAKDVVRATLMRATIHVMTARDFVAFRGALAPAILRGMSAVRKRIGSVDIDAVVEAARACFDEAPRTFESLRDVLAKRYPKLDVRALAYAARLHLPLVMVPTHAPWGHPANADFATAESWLGRKIDAREGGAKELVVRYLAAFGPATPADAQTWSGLPGLRAVFDSLAPELVSLRDERGKELFDLPNAPRPPEDAPAPVRFLPEFDNLLLGHADRTRVVADRDRKPVYLSALRIAPTILVDGFVEGTWKIVRSKSRATLVVEPFRALKRSAKDELGAEAEALAKFMEPDAAAHEVSFAKIR